MRKAYHKAGFIEDSGKVIGISLGYDYCAEHEIGINHIKEALGIGTNTKAAKKDPWVRHQVTKFPDANVITSFSKSEAALCFIESERQAKYITEYQPDYIKKNTALSLYGNEKLATAWDHASFGIHVKGKENVEKLKVIYEAFQRCDIAQGVKNDGPFGGSGLVFIIESEIQEELKEQTREEHRSHDRLLQAAEKTGIEKKLMESGCRYYALSPKWQDPENESKGVRWWLNPMNQHNNNCGWYGLMELEQWAMGKGPIPKKNSEV